jgi:hypothetical protein
MPISFSILNLVKVFRRQSDHMPVRELYKINGVTQSIGNCMNFCA